MTEEDFEPPRIRISRYEHSVAIKWAGDENWYRFEPDQVRYLNEHERCKVGPGPGDWPPDEEWIDPFDDPRPDIRRWTSPLRAVLQEAIRAFSMSRSAIRGPDRSPADHRAPEPRADEHMLADTAPLSFVPDSTRGPGPGRGRTYRPPAVPPHDPRTTLTSPVADTTAGPPRRALGWLLASLLGCLMGRVIGC